MRARCQSGRCRQRVPRASRDAVEWLIVLALLVLTTAVVPRHVLRSSCRNASEASATGGLKTIEAAQQDYRSASPARSFAATLEQLRTGDGSTGARLIDDSLGAGRKSGYIFVLYVQRSPEGIVLDWSAEARPAVYRDGSRRSFFIDRTGVLRGADVGGAPGSVDLPEL
jgi:type II secretory pathway pseudopilin PulG